MRDDNSHGEWLKQDLGWLIDMLGIFEMQKRFMRLRWLDQVLWMEGKAASAQRRYYTLRLVAIIGGVIVPALVGLKIGEQGVCP